MDFIFRMFEKFERYVLDVVGGDEVKEKVVMGVRLFIEYV